MAADCRGFCSLLVNCFLSQPLIFVSALLKFSATLSPVLSVSKMIPTVPWGIVTLLDVHYLQMPSAADIYFLQTSVCKQNNKLYCLLWEQSNRKGFSLSKAVQRPQHLNFSLQVLCFSKVKLYASDHFSCRLFSQVIWTIGFPDLLILPNHLQMKSTFLEMVDFEPKMLEK